MEREGVRSLASTGSGPAFLQGLSSRGSTWLSGYPSLTEALSAYLHGLRAW